VYSNLGASLGSTLAALPVACGPLSGRKQTWRMSCHVSAETLSRTTKGITFASKISPSVMRRRITLPSNGLAAFASLKLENQLPRPPNYKQEKKRREELQKKRNEAQQREIAERRKPPADPQPP
jgi:hypothetical protein